MFWAPSLKVVSRRDAGNPEALVLRGLIPKLRQALLMRATKLMLMRSAHRVSQSVRQKELAEVSLRKRSFDEYVLTGVRSDITQHYYCHE